MTAVILIMWLFSAFYTAVWLRRGCGVDGVQISLCLLFWPVVFFVLAVEKVSKLIDREEK